MAGFSYDVREATVLFIPIEIVYYSSISVTKKTSMKKRDYEKPSMKVVMLQQRTMLLAGSGLGSPDNYPELPDPLQF